METKDALNQGKNLGAPLGLPGIGTGTRGESLEKTTRMEPLPDPIAARRPVEGYPPDALPSIGTPIGIDRGESPLENLPQVIQPGPEAIKPNFEDQKIFGGKNEPPNRA